MKRLLVLFILFMGIYPCLADEDYSLRDYNGVEIPKGTFIPVISTQEISTFYCDEGSPVKFISTSDLYLYETNIIPSETELSGYIEKINEPIVGTNGSMIIKINKLKLSDGFEIPMHGYIYSTSGNLLGGELTPPASYDRMPSYRAGFGKGYLRDVPGPVRRMGEHKVIASGTDLIIILVKPLWITHTVTN